MSQKVSYASKIIDSIVNGLSPNDVSSHLYIFDHSIVTFVTKEKCLGFLKTYRVESLDRFIISVVDKVETHIYISKKEYNSKPKNENKICK